MNTGNEKEMLEELRGLRRAAERRAAAAEARAAVELAVNANPDSVGSLGPRDIEKAAETIERSGVLADGI